MMKKVISLVFGLLIGLAVWAQETADTSASAKDSDDDDRFSPSDWLTRTSDQQIGRAHV